jgi:peptidoglycan/LPS O-acetylase OafA/YrhL
MRRVVTALAFPSALLVLGIVLLAPRLGLGSGDTFVLYRLFGVRRSALFLAAFAVLVGYLARFVRARWTAWRKTLLFRLLLDFDAAAAPPTEPHRPATPIAGHGQLRYRPEVDGLRAIAVTSVVLYHAGLSLRGVDLFRGGFIGVDIFFVISGYLITFILLTQLRDGSFSIIGFYERRARRILPALFAVLVATLTLGWFSMLPKAFNEFAESVVSSILFASNFYFWTHDTYGAEPSALKPLLHTWSLAVEEQFYLIYPLALLALWRRLRRPIASAMLLLLAASLALAQWSSGKYPDAAFYLLPTRGWELLAGALLATCEMHIGRAGNALFSHMLVPLGAVCIIWSFFAFHDRMQHPAFITLVPIVGTMLLIWFARPGERVSDLLASAPFRGIGLISYSFYLWHFPVFAFDKIRTAAQPAVAQKFGLIALSLIFATASYWFVERPFRRRELVPAARFVPATIVVALMLGTAGALVVNAHGVPSRLPEILSTAMPAPEWWELKQDGRACHRYELEPCIFTFRPGHDDWILVGDSHAGMLAKNFYDALEAAGASSFSTFVWGGCPFALDVRQERDQEPSCLEANQAKYKFLTNNRPSTVVISQRMGFWLEGTRFDNGEGGREEGPRNRIIAVRGSAIQNVTRTIRSVLDMGHRVVLVYPVPEVGWVVPQKVLSEISGKSYAEVKAWLQTGGVTTSFDLYLRRNRRAFEAYDAVASNDRLLRIYPHLLFCSEESRRCFTHDRSEFFYSDTNHLSHAGGKRLVERILADADAKWHHRDVAAGTDVR